MKFRNIYIAITLLSLAYIFMGHSAGRADAENWGNTGAPGDQLQGNGDPRTCISCHASGAISVDLQIDILNEDGSALANNEYIPGTTYNMAVRVERTAGAMPSKYGFQMVALTDSDEQEVNTWANPSANVAIATASNTGRTYVEQTTSSDDNVFTMEWTAPASGKGNVTFYSCGNGVNNNGGTTGDGAACTTLTLGEAVSNSVVAINSDALQLEVSPNPATNYLNVQVDSSIQDDFTMNVLSLNGQLMQSRAWSLSSNNSVDLDISDLPAGMYFIQLSNESYSTTTKWVKL